MIILPISHEKLSVQRLPWITIGIIALNIVIFIISWFVITGEQKQIQTQARKVAEYYQEHPYLKLSDYFVNQLPKFYRRLLEEFQQEAARHKEERDKRLSAFKEIQESRRQRDLETGNKNLLQIKERRFSARSAEERDALDKKIEELENKLEKLKDAEGKGLDLKTASTVEEEQAELDRLTQELQRAVQSTFVYKYGLVPADVQWYAFLTSIFLHGGWMHLLGNMLFLWLSGCNIEDLWGRMVYPLFYLIGGVFGSLGHVLVSPNSTQPLIGASGAIAAVMGAFMVRLYNTRIKFFYFIWLLFFFIRWGTFLAPAWIMLLLWLLENMAYGLISNYLGGGGIAYWAHVGGFLFGAVVALSLKLTGVEEKYLAPAIEKKIGVFKQHPKIASGIEKLDKGRMDAALADFKAVLRDNPQDVDARRQMVEVYKKKNQLNLVQQELKELLGTYLRKNQSELAADTYIELKGWNPQFVLEPKNSWAVAQALEKIGRFDMALPEYYALYKNNPGGPLAVRALIRCGNLLLEHLREPEQARQAFETAKNLAGNDPVWSQQIEAGLEKVKSGMITPVSAGIEVSGTTPVSVSPAADSPEAAASIYYQGTSSLIDLGAPITEQVPARARQIQAHPVKVKALLPQGIHVITKDGKEGMFSWDKIKSLFAGRIIPPPPQKGIYLFLDLIIGKTDSPTVLMVKTMRVNAAELTYQNLIEDPQPQGLVNFKKFTGKIMQLCPQAAALPNSQNILGSFREYQNIETYEADLGLWVERRL